ILLPFFIISIGLGALAWRSYVLSVKMERGAKEAAQQAAAYAAEIKASRVDAAVSAEMIRVADLWQQSERQIGEPSFPALRDWLGEQSWIIDAIYVPDFDPASSIYVSEQPAGGGAPPMRRTREFFTSTGSIRYTYDPRRLLALPGPHAAVAQRLPTVPQSRQYAEISIVQGQKGGLTTLEDGFAVVAPLAPPLQDFGVRAVVRTAYVGGKGWESQRVISAWMSLVAVILTGAGALLAWRGMNKEAETMKLRGALIANVSHELRTPLSMIRLGAETLKRGRLKEKERAEIEDQILREVLLLSHLVENVLDVARIQNQSTRALAFTPVHPRDLIRNLVTTYESWIRSKGFVCSIEIDESVGEQMWDRDAVSRALLNLIDNAIKYSGESGERAIEVALRQTAEHVVLEVKDHGIGIAAKDLARIFDPYYRARFSDTTTRRGAGLGLTLVQQIVAAHGGRVEVESEPGVGSAFRLLFPRDLTAHPSDVLPMPQAQRAF
ncbi:MAG TPA: HAMP domain-containing sensor histidine kinase, partial [Thermoanaerobaculia bacterium]|nr:HAMP domain-containing sensor histidine kinase [Thermoanaerobaculia bacterium]